MTMRNIFPIRDVSVFYLFRHLTSKRADLARLGGELGGKLRGQVHLTVCRDIWMVIFWGGSLQIYLKCHLRVIFLLAKCIPSTKKYNVIVHVLPP